MKKCGAKLKILLDQQIIIQMNIMRTIFKSNSTQMMIHLWEKMLKLHGIILVVRYVFNNENEYYLQASLDAFLYKLAG